MKWLFPLGLFTLLACQPSHPTEIQMQSALAPMDSSIAGDAEVAALIAPYKEELDAKMNEVIGYTSAAFDNSGGPTRESTLGDFVADLLLEESQSRIFINLDLAVINHHGGLRTSINKGDVTVRNIYELMPFENEMWILALDGHHTQMLFDNAAKRKSNVIAGATFGIKDDTVATNIVINGKPFDSTRTYLVSISDYLAGGGGGHGFLNEEMIMQDLNYRCRDMIIDHIRRVSGEKGDTLHPKIDGRVRIVE